MTIEFHPLMIIKCSYNTISLSWRIVVKAQNVLNIIIFIPSLFISLHLSTSQPVDNQAKLQAQTQTALQKDIAKETQDDKKSLSEKQQQTLSAQTSSVTDDQSLTTAPQDTTTQKMTKEIQDTTLSETPKDYSSSLEQEIPAGTTQDISLPYQQPAAPSSTAGPASEVEDKEILDPTAPLPAAAQSGTAAPPDTTAVPGTIPSPVAATTPVPGQIVAEGQTIIEEQPPGAPPDQILAADVAEQEIPGQEIPEELVPAESAEIPQQEDQATEPAPQEKIPAEEPAPASPEEEIEEEIPPEPAPEQPEMPLPELIIPAPEYIPYEGDMLFLDTSMIL